MEIKTIKNLIYKGYAQKRSCLDVIYPLKDAKLPLVIFAHGFKGFKDWGHFPLLCKKIAASGFCVVKFNFSHNGGSVEQPIDFPDLEAFSKNSYWKELTDVEGVLKFLKQDFVKMTDGPDLNLNKISMVGHSRGGGIALLAAQKYPAIKKVVGWAAVSDFKSRLPDSVQLNQWKKEGVRFIANARTKQNMPMNYSFVEELYAHDDELNIETAVRKMSADLLLIHGTQDETLNPTMARQITAWHQAAKMKLIDGAGHTFGGKHPWDKNTLPETSKELLQETIQFLKQE